MLGKVGISFYRDKISYFLILLGRGIPLRVSIARKGTSHFSAGSKTVSETVNTIWYSSDENCTLLPKCKLEWDLQLLTCWWCAVMGLHLRHDSPPSLCPSPLSSSQPPTFSLSALSSVQLFTFSKVIYFRDNLIMSKPTLLCSITHQDGPEKEGGKLIDPFCLAAFTWGQMNFTASDLGIIRSVYCKQLPTPPSHFLITLLCSISSTIPYLLFQKESVFSCSSITADKTLHELTSEICATEEIR